METWNFAISFATNQPGNRSEHIYVEGCYTQPAAGSTTHSSSLAACIKVLPVLTSTRVENYSLAAALVMGCRGAIAPSI